MSALFMLLFLVVPIVELVIFTVVVDAIGLGNTVLVILATAVLGASLVRWQGTSVFRRFQEDRMLGRIPAAPIIHGVLILVGGALLLTPGFLTDGVGFSLMVPPVREAVYRVTRRLVQRRTILFR
jgi:UPF0716 protein FxsA